MNTVKNANDVSVNIWLQGVSLVCAFASRFTHQSLPTYWFHESVYDLRDQLGPYPCTSNNCRIAIHTSFPIRTLLDHGGNNVGFATPIILILHCAHADFLNDI